MNWVKKVLFIHGCEYNNLKYYTVRLTMSLLYRTERMPDSSGISVALSLFILLGLSLAVATN